MNTFSRGQKGKLADLGCQSPLTVTIDLQAAGMALDVSCFGLDAADKLSDDRYMVFFNQLASPGNAVALTLSTGKAVFRVDLNALPDAVSKLVFTAAIDGAGSMRGIGSGSITLGESVTFPLSGADFQDEKALILGEIYRKDGVWRFGAVGQGFNGGLSALLAHFGGTQAAADTASPPASATTAPAATAGKKISLSKVTLEKRGDKISLDKQGSQGYGRIRVNLNWDQGAVTAAPEKQGFLSRLRNVGKSGGIDLDLACLYQMGDGTAGGVQALGEAWGNYDARPFVHLAGDDRSGTSKDGEDLWINGDRFDAIKRILIFTFIYEGAPNWGVTNGVVTIEVPNQAPVEVRLDHGGSEAMCAIAMIENQGGKLQVTKLVEYFSQGGGVSAHEQMDRKYGFGLKWRTGSK